MSASPPGWGDPLFSAEEMRAADAFAVERAGLPSLDLMERAGEGLARLVAAARAGRAGPVRIVVGKGNNGGDGLVVARLLRQDGHPVDVLAVGPVEEMEGDARVNLERLPGPPPQPFAAEGLAGSGVVLDAIFGTGFSGAPREPVAGAIATLNELDCPIVACDVPSGVDATSGEVAGEAVRATVTGTFHAEKIGLRVAPGAFHAGRVEVVPIGLPREAPAAASAWLITERVLGLVPPRSPEGSKFTSGVVVIAAGARGMTGAPTMAALAAMRAGAGYVQLAVPDSTQSIFALKLLEAMTHGMPEEDGAHVPEGAEHVAALAERAGAVVLGPGLGKGDGAVGFARGVARKVPAPLLIDADGLNAHAGALEDLRGRPGPTILTPHAAELGRLLERDTDWVGAHRLEAAREAAARSGAVVVLKGHDSIVAAPDGPVAVSPGATPALATAGTGDVLSGLTGALVAKGLDPFAAGAAGVLVHARAGARAAHRHGAGHVIASDVIDALPAAFAHREQGGREAAGGA